MKIGLLAEPGGRGLFAKNATWCLSRCLRSKLVGNCAVVFNQFKSRKTPVLCSVVLVGEEVLTNSAASIYCASLRNRPRLLAMLSHPYCSLRLWKIYEGHTAIKGRAMTLYLAACQEVMWITDCSKITGCTISVFTCKIFNLSMLRIGSVVHSSYKDCTTKPAILPSMRRSSGRRVEESQFKQIDVRRREGMSRSHLRHRQTVFNSRERR